MASFRAVFNVGFLTVANSPFETPSGLKEKGRHLWDLYVAHFGDSLPSLDLVMLEQACKYADLLDRLHEQVHDNSENNAGMVRLGIATDKFLLFSSHLGLTYADRVKLKIELSARDKAQAEADRRKAEDIAAGKKVETRGRKKAANALEQLRPEAIGLMKTPTPQENNAERIAD